MVAILILSKWLEGAQRQEHSGVQSLKDTSFYLEVKTLVRLQPLKKLQDGSVHALIWELEPADEVALDRYEGFPTFYRKETVKVRYGGKLTEVMVYIMNEGRPMGLPSRYYYDTILKGYETAGFDTSILSKAVRVSAGKEA